MKKSPAMVTVTGAAELIERDRATLVRALRDIRPDRVDGKREGGVVRLYGTHESYVRPSLCLIDLGDDGDTRADCDSRPGW
jgi:hypothetical protein